MRHVKRLSGARQRRVLKEHPPSGPFRTRGANGGEKTASSRSKPPMTIWASLACNTICSKFSLLDYHAEKAESS